MQIRGDLADMLRDVHVHVHVESGAGKDYVLTCRNLSSYQAVLSTRYKIVLQSLLMYKLPTISIIILDNYYTALLYYKMKYSNFPSFMK